MFKIILIENSVIVGLIITWETDAAVLEIEAGQIKDGVARVIPLIMTGVLIFTVKSPLKSACEIFFDFTKKSSEEISYSGWVEILASF